MNSKANNIDFFEDLSVVDVCPPNDVIIPNGEDEFYRVLKSEQIKSKHFLPKKLSENDKIKVDPCIAKSVSLSNNVEWLLYAYYKTPAHKKKARLVGVLTLNSEDGRIKQTFAKCHYSWWRSSVFEPSNVNVKRVLG